MSGNIKKRNRSQIDEFLYSDLLSDRYRVDSFVWRIQMQILSRR